MTKTKQVNRLLNNPDFKSLVLDEYLHKDIIRLVLSEDIDSEAVRASLRARKDFYDYLQYCEEFDSIEALKHQ